MAEKTATEASNDFWQEFKAEKRGMFTERPNSNALPKTELPTHFNKVLQQINSLEKSLTKATEFIPSYDERQFSLQIKVLSETLEQIKAELLPRAKFSFKSRKKKPVATDAASFSTIPQAPSAVADDNILSEATVLFKDKQGTVLTLDDESNATNDGKSIDILISNLKDCVVILDEDKIQISAVHIKNVEHCVIYCGKIEGSVLIYGLTNSALVAACHQFRMHEAHSVDLMLNVTSRPIIEDSDNIQVCEWSMVSTSTNYFDQIEDFNWLKKQASPNWKLMDQAKTQLLGDGVKILQNNGKKEATLSTAMKLLPSQSVKSN
ncbi:tubulin binding cofactor C-domain-containing protein [Parasitella parasitica]|nr:tubulin binding cofactor C-domain-containing protein [Parasitella parasitica]